ncbi:MAG: glycosyltransferase [Candidatus Gracilibacteria bacterium]
MKILERSILHNLANAGDTIDEIIWVDNGSKKDVHSFMKKISPDISVLNKENTGVARGYNKGFILASGDYIVIPGTDTLLPKNWLKIFKQNAVDGVACMNSGIELKYLNHDAVGPKIINRMVFDIAGYMREDFGLYGGDDVEWGERIRSRGLACVAFPCKFKHMGTEGISRWTKKSNETKEYHDFKFKEATDTTKAEKHEACKKLGYPYYNPFLFG